MEKNQTKFFFPFIQYYLYNPKCFKKTGNNKTKKNKNFYIFFKII